MTEETLHKAQRNRGKRLLALRRYNLVSDIINHLGADFTPFSVRYKNSGNDKLNVIPTSEDEFREYMISIRDRLDNEISELDKEFAEL